ncbi:MAG: hypothetical protein R2761_07675 [Acidimicrobiales bacterium]
MTDGPPQPPPAFLDPASLVFPARVVEVRPTGIVLSQSRFVPESAERQSDAGRIDDILIAGVSRGADGELVHHLADPRLLGSVDPGRQVRAEIDPRRRANLSRLHSALHLLWFAYQTIHRSPARRLGRRVDVVSARLEVPRPDGTATVAAPTASPTAPNEAQANEAEAATAAAAAADCEAEAAALAGWLRRAVAADLRIDHVQGGSPNRLHWVVDGIGSVACLGPHPPSTGAVGPLAVTVEELDVDRLTLTARLATRW